MAELKINLETKEKVVFAHSVDLLGCYAYADSKSAAIDGILKDSKAYCEWLQKLELSSELKLVIKELLKGITNVNIIEEVKMFPGSSKIQAHSTLFNSEREELSQETFEAYLSIINKLPEELMRIIFQLTIEELERKGLEGQDSIKDELKDLYQTELDLMKKFGEEVERKFYEIINLTRDELESLSILERVVKVRQGAIALLRQYFSQLQQEVRTSPKEEAGVPSEEWSLKKILRIFIEHEREKIKKIAGLVDSLHRTDEHLTA
ncbi:MAG: hypothetical protein K9W42_04240 [Candidatus Heimdallarchaeota archaeon]|nr:hypothetical protein [Candidatus Heimdallarchaeota archaeon]